MSKWQDLKAAIESAFEQIEELNSHTDNVTKEAVATALNLLDKGEASVAERDSNGQWFVNDWLKKAVLLHIKISEKHLIEGGPGNTLYWDNVKSKFDGWTEEHYRAANFRVLPGAIVRHSAYIAPRAVLLPSFVNVGARVGEGTLVDTWATVGSCANIGKNVHLSGGVGIGGVLEPLQASPTIIEDNCFIGARSEVVEGCIVREGSVLGMGVYLSKSTKVVNRATGEITYGEIPPYSVAVAGSIASDTEVGHKINPHLYCVVIVKQVDQKTRSKTGINELLRS